MCEVEVQVNISGHANSNKRTEDEKEKGKLFLNVIENLEQKCMNQDSEDN